MLLLVAGCVGCFVSLLILLLVGLAVDLFVVPVD